MTTHSKEALADDSRRRSIVFIVEAEICCTADSFDLSTEEYLVDTDEESLSDFILELPEMPFQILNRSVSLEVMDVEVPYFIGVECTKFTGRDIAIFKCSFDVKVDEDTPGPALSEAFVKGMEREILGAVIKRLDPVSSELNCYLLKPLKWTFGN